MRRRIPKFPADIFVLVAGNRLCVQASRLGLTDDM